MRQILGPISFIAGLATGGLLIIVGLVVVTLGSDVVAADAFPKFLYKWQTLFAGLFGIFAGGFAIIAAIISARHGERFAAKQQKLKEDALCTIIRQDTIQTLHVVCELAVWIDVHASNPNHPMPYKNFVMGESLVNVWSAFPFVPPQIAKELFEFSHAMFDCQIRTKQLGELDKIELSDPASRSFLNSVARARSAGEALLAALDASHYEHGTCTEQVLMKDNLGSGQKTALIVFALLATLSAGLFLLAGNMPEDWRGLMGTPVLYIVLLLLALHLLVMALPFLLYVRNRPILLQRVEVLALRENDAPISTGGLFNEFVSTFVIALVVSIITLCIYWATHWFSENGHLISLTVAMVALFLLSLWANRDEALIKNLSKTTPLIVVTGGLSFGLFFGFKEHAGPLEVPEIIAWLVPASYLWLTLRERLRGNKQGGEADDLSPFQPFHLLWYVSEIILRKVRRGATANQAFAILLTLLIFVLPDQVAAVTPDGLAAMFSDVWNRFGELSITKDHVSYVALAVFVAFSCSDFASIVPDLVPETWLLLGGLYNAILKAVVGLIFLIAIAPLFILLFAVGDAFLGPDLAIIVGFFTFPSWSQRVFALFAAAFTLSFDHAGSVR